MLVECQACGTIGHVHPDKKTGWLQITVKPSGKVLLYCPQCAFLIASLPVARRGKLRRL